MITISVKEWERRKHFVQFEEEDITRLKELLPVVEKQVDKVVEQLYENFEAIPELSRILHAEEGRLEKLKRMQRAYFLQLFEGDYGSDYLNNRLKVGMAHHRINLGVDWYLGAYSMYIRLVMPIILDHYKKDPAKGQAAFASAIKIIHLDQDVAISTYLSAREEVIAEQSEEILELSTPVVQLWDGIVAAPIIGTLDSQRTQLFMERLLQTIVDTKSPVALVDITGVPAIDTATAQHLIDTINAVKLLGSTVVITGVSPSIAQTLVHLGIDLSDILTRSSLAEGLKVALKQLNLVMTTKGA
ncbi:MAG: protoglobin domain-containing protein [bacterium]|nr:protoglobin domain-containing protein [bacterium]